MKYLTEQSLGEFLESIYTGIIKNKRIDISEINYRPDFLIPDIKLVIEYDGHLHYTNAATIKRDILKDYLLKKYGYKIIRIPYFIQLSKEIIKLLFNREITYIQTYPHGFIDKKCIMPSDFCELGILKFKEDLNKFECVYPDIIMSLKNKAIELEDIDLVLPPTLQSYLK